MPAGTPAWVNLSDRILIELGGGIVDVELPQTSLDNAITESLQEFRSNTDSSTIEGYQFLRVIDNERFYSINGHVVDITNVSRLGAGIVSGIEGLQFGTFLYQSIINQQPFDLLSFHLTQAFIEDLNRMTAADPNYIFHSGLDGSQLGYTGLDPGDETTNVVVTSPDMAIDNLDRLNGPVLELLQVPKTDDNIYLLHVQYGRSDAELINDMETGRFIHYYARACSKIMLGHAYRKHDNAPSVGGSMSLPGNDLIQEGTKEKEDLLQDLQDLKYGEDVHGLMMG